MADKVRAMPVLEIIAVLLVTVVCLTGAAILRNGVPVSAPPGKLARITAYLTTNFAETRDEHPFPELCTRRYDLDPEPLLARLDAAIDLLGWTNDGSVDSKILRAEVRTPLLGFTDDLMAEVISGGEGQSKLRVRSASRLGRGDLGANAGHILRLYEAIDRVSAVAGKP